MIEPVEPDELRPFGPVRAVLPAPFPTEGFEVFQLSMPALSPAVAVTPDHSLFYAYIDADTGRPSVSRAEGTPIELPSDARLTTRAIALAASNDGRMHVLWDAGGEILYVRLGADGVFEPTQVLSGERASEPNLVLAPGGEVVAGWVEPGADDEAPRILLAVGQPSDDGVVFDTPMAVNAGCCDEPEAAYAMSGPSIAVGEDGSIHVTYEWSSFGRTVIDYIVRRDMVWSEPLLVSEAAFSPCPAIALDPEGVAHITFIRELDTGVFHTSIRDGVVSEPRVIYEPESGRATVALLTIDPAGRAHLGVTEHGLTRRLVYLQLADLVSAPAEMRVIHDQERGTVSLTMRAGGMLIAPDGKLLFAFQSQDEGTSTSHVAMGR